MAARALPARRILDAATGASLRYVVEPVDRALFLCDGTLLLHCGREMMLVDPGGARLLWRGAVPPGYENALVLGVR